MIYMKDRNRQMRGRIQIDDEPRSPNEGGMFQIYDEPESPREGACLRSMMNRKTRKIPPFTKTRELTFKNIPPAERIASNTQCVWNLSKPILSDLSYRHGSGFCNPPPPPTPRFFTVQAGLKERRVMKNTTHLRLFRTHDTSREFAANLQSACIPPPPPLPATPRKHSKQNKEQTKTQTRQKLHPVKTE